MSANGERLDQFDEGNPARGHASEVEVIPRLAASPMTSRRSRRSIAEAVSNTKGIGTKALQHSAFPAVLEPSEISLRHTSSQSDALAPGRRQGVEPKQLRHRCRLMRAYSRTGTPAFFKAAPTSCRRFSQVSLRASTLGQVNAPVRM
jgi:hypothetical protein